VPSGKSQTIAQMVYATWNTAVIQTYISGITSVWFIEVRP